MTFPQVTAVYAALFGLLYAALSAWVIAGRIRYRVSLLDGGKDAMARRIRAHANFAEYVPLVLILAGLVEATGVDGRILHALLLPLLAARLAHPIGMMAATASGRQFALRGVGASVTLLVLAASAVILLIRVV